MDTGDSCGQADSCINADSCSQADTVVADRQIVAEADSYSKTGSCIQADSCRRAFICMQIIAEKQIRLAGRQKGRKTNCETCRKAESRLVQIQFSALPSQLMPACLPYTLYSYSI